MGAGCLGGAGVCVHQQAQAAVSGPQPWPCPAAAGGAAVGQACQGVDRPVGGRRGLVNSLVARGKTRQASRAAGMLLSAFGEGNFFIELTALDDADLVTLPKLAELAADLGIPIVAA